MERVLKIVIGGIYQYTVMKNKKLSTTLRSDPLIMNLKDKVSPDRTYKITLNVALPLLITKTTYL